MSATAHVECTLTTEFLPNCKIVESEIRLIGPTRHLRLAPDHSTRVRFGAWDDGCWFTGCLDPPHLNSNVTPRVTAAAKERAKLNMDCTHRRMRRGIGLCPADGNVVLLVT